MWHLLTIEESPCGWLWYCFSHKYKFWMEYALNITFLKTWCQQKLPIFIEKKQKKFVEFKWKKHFQIIKEIEQWHIFLLLKYLEVGDLSSKGSLPGSSTSPTGWVLWMVLQAEDLWLFWPSALGQAGSGPEICQASWSAMVCNTFGRHIFRTNLSNYI